jgi:prepilin-type N-terminal cleavage/methylation domain-containing protein
MHKGFTLIELLIVVAIIGILAAVGAAVIPGILLKTKVTASNAQFNKTIKDIKLEILKCEIDPSAKIEHKSYPGGTIYNMSCNQFNEGGLMDWYAPGKCSDMYYSNEYKSPFGPFASGGGMGEETCGSGNGNPSTNEGVFHLQGKNSNNGNGCIIVSMPLQNEVLKKVVCQQN